MKEKQAIKKIATQLLSGELKLDLYDYTCHQIAEALGESDRVPSMSTVLKGAAREWCDSKKFEVSNSFIEVNVQRMLEAKRVDEGAGSKEFYEMCAELRTEWLTWLRDTW